MFRYAFQPHTADVRMHVVADSLEELYIGALQGMNELLNRTTDCEPCSFPIVANVDVSSNDPTSLLIDFLNEVLTRTLLDKALFCRITHVTVAPDRICASLRGTPIEMFDEDIKAVTYHGANVLRDVDGRFEVTVVFDI